MAEADWRARVVYIPKAILHNEPASPSVVKEWARALSEIPECQLKDKAAAAITAYLRDVGPTWLTVWLTPNVSTQANQHTSTASQPASQPASQTASQTASQPASHQEQEQEQEQEESTTLSSVQTARPLDDVISNGFKTDAREILDFLNRKTGRAYRAVPVNLTLIEARLKSGATRAQMQAVIAVKVRQWTGDATMARFLRPATLFNATKFEQYVGELPNKPVGSSGHSGGLPPEWTRGLTPLQVQEKLKAAAQQGVQQGGQDG